MPAQKASSGGWFGPQGGRFVRPCNQNNTEVMSMLLGALLPILVVLVRTHIRIRSTMRQITRNGRAACNVHRLPAAGAAGMMVAG
jgi:hypothetical protein